MLREFGSIVSDVIELGELQEQTDFLALIIRKEVQGQYRTSQFKVCLLASLAALIPNMWNAKFDHAWSWLWDSIEAQLTVSLKTTAQHEKFILKYVPRLGENDYDYLGNVVWKRMFEKVPQAELQFKQSFAIFIRIATLALKLCPKVYEEPARTKAEIERIGLQHIMHRVKPEWMQMFAQLLGEEAKYHSKEDAVAEAVSWTLLVIASLMGRIVVQGSNPVLLAALTNDVKGLKTALGSIPRGTRTKAALHI
jgi:hemoglobin-like flavoprotein